MFETGGGGGSEGIHCVCYIQELGFVMLMLLTTLVWGTAELRGPSTFHLTPMQASLTQWCREDFCRTLTSSGLESENYRIPAHSHGFNLVYTIPLLSSLSPFYLSYRLQITVRAVTCLTRAYNCIRSSPCNKFFSICVFVYNIHKHLHVLLLSD